MKITSKLLKFIFVAVLVCQLIGLPAIPQAFDIDLDPSVVLYLPFYKYGSETGSKIFDESQYGNHGTIVGAVPALIPMLSGKEEMVNGSFETDPNVEWIPSNGTIASVAGGQSGNCLEIIRVSGNEQYARQTFSSPLTVGKKYKVLWWIKSGTSGNEQSTLHITQSGVGSTVYYERNTTASWAYYEAIFTADSNSVQIALSKDSATPGTMLFDQVSIQEVTGYTGGQGWQFDGVDDKVTVADSPSINFGIGNFTMLSWINVLNVVGNNQKAIIQKIESVGGNYYGYGMAVGPALKLVICKETPEILGFNSINFIDDGTWKMGVISVDRGTNIAYIYINGVLDSSSDISAIGDTTVTNSQSLEIGFAMHFTQWFKGQIGNVTIFNRALSAQEIRNIYELTRHRYGR